MFISTCLTDFIVYCYNKTLLYIFNRFGAQGNIIIYSCIIDLWKCDNVIYI